MLLVHRKSVSCKFVSFCIGVIGWATLRISKRAWAAAQDGRKRMAFSTLIGLAMAGAALLVYVIQMPWGGRVRNERMHTPLLILLIAIFFVGAAFALMGFPEPMKFNKR
jgi:hypothetical protein